jgi:hypothetical protein
MTTDTTKSTAEPAPTDEIPQTAAAAVPVASCKSCGAVLTGKFCQACGQKAAIHPITTGYLLREIPHAVFHVDHGFGATVVGLARRPGTLINEYLDGRRAKYFNPLTFLIIWAGLVALLFAAHPFNYEVLGGEARLGPRHAEFVRLQFRYYSLSLIFYLPAMAVVTYLCFLRNGRAFGEHLVINAYITGFWTLIIAAAFPLLAIANVNDALVRVWNLMLLPIAAYHIWAMYQVFYLRGSGVSTFIRALTCFILYLAVVAGSAPLFFFVYSRFF